MENKQILDTIKKLREGKKRKFSQSIDFSIILRDLDFKKPESNINEFLVLPVKLDKEVKICGLVDKELEVQAREVFNKTISKGDFDKWKGKKLELKKLSKEYDYFVAQATIMTNVAATFGKVFGPKGKLPHPKAGCIVPPKIDLKPLAERIKRTIRIQNKKQPVISVRVGTESMSDEDIAKNITAVYNFVKNKVPRGEHQIKNTFIKLTMGNPIAIGA